MRRNLPGGCIGDRIADLILMTNIRVTGSRQRDHSTVAAFGQSTAAPPGATVAQALKQRDLANILGPFGNCNAIHCTSIAIGSDTILANRHCSIEGAVSIDLNGLSDLTACQLNGVGSRCTVQLDSLSRDSTQLKIRFIVGNIAIIRESYRVALSKSSKAQNHIAKINLVANCRAVASTRKCILHLHDQRVIHIQAQPAGASTIEIGSNQCQLIGTLCKGTVKGVIPHSILSILIFKGTPGQEASGTVLDPNEDHFIMLICAGRCDGETSSEGSARLNGCGNTPRVSIQDWSAHIEFLHRIAISRIRSDRHAAAALGIAGSVPPSHRIRRQDLLHDDLPKVLGSLNNRNAVNGSLIAFRSNAVLTRGNHNRKGAVSIYLCSLADQTVTKTNFLGDFRTVHHTNAAGSSTDLQILLLVDHIGVVGEGGRRAILVHDQGNMAVAQIHDYVLIDMVTGNTDKCILQRKNGNIVDIQDEPTGTLAVNIRGNQSQIVTIFGCHCFLDCATQRMIPAMVFTCFVLECAPCRESGIIVVHINKQRAILTVSSAEAKASAFNCSLGDMSSRLPGSCTCKACADLELVTHVDRDAIAIGHGDGCTAAVFDNAAAAPPAHAATKGLAQFNFTELILFGSNRNAVIYACVAFSGNTILARRHCSHEASIGSNRNRPIGNTICHNSVLRHCHAVLFGQLAADRANRQSRFRIRNIVGIRVGNSITGSTSSQAQLHITQVHLFPCSTTVTAADKGILDLQNRNIIDIHRQPTCACAINVGSDQSKLISVVRCNRFLCLFTQRPAALSCFLRSAAIHNSTPGIEAGFRVSHIDKQGLALVVETGREATHTSCTIRNMSRNLPGISAGNGAADLILNTGVALIKIAILDRNGNTGAVNAHLATIPPSVILGNSLLQFNFTDMATTGNNSNGINEAVVAIQSDRDLIFTSGKLRSKGSVRRNRYGSDILTKADRYLSRERGAAYFYQLTSDNFQLVINCNKDGVRLANTFCILRLKIVQFCLAGNDPSPEHIALSHRVFRYCEEFSICIGLFVQNRTIMISKGYFTFYGLILGYIDNIAFCNLCPVSIEIAHSRFTLLDPADKTMAGQCRCFRNNEVLTI